MYRRKDRFAKEEWQQLLQRGEKDMKRFKEKKKNQEFPVILLLQTIHNVNLSSSSKKFTTNFGDRDFQTYFENLGLLDSSVSLTNGAPVCGANHPANPPAGGASAVHLH